MGVTLRPSGPLPPSVYWLRRGALALLALGVAALVIALVTVHRHPHRAAATTPPAGRTPPTPPAGRTPPTAAASTPNPTATAGGTPACSAADLVVTVTTSARTYAPGSTAVFTAAVHTTAPCRVATPTFEVTSGPVRVWDSADCAKPPSTVVLDVRTGAVSERWDLRRSAPGCATVVGTTTATAGTYHVTATVAGVTSAPVRFAIS